MCGRFALTSNLSELQGRFGFIAEQQVVEAKYNIAPTDPVLTVINDGQRRGQIMRWGLIPFWAKDAKIGSRMINAVGETVSAKPAFRNRFPETPVLGLGQRVLRVEEERQAAHPSIHLPEVRRAHGICRSVGDLEIP